MKMVSLDKWYLKYELYDAGSCRVVAWGGGGLKIFNNTYKLKGLDYE